MPWAGEGQGGNGPTQRPDWPPIQGAVNLSVSGLHSRQFIYISDMPGGGGGGRPGEG